MEIIQMNLKFLAFHFVNQKKRDFFLSLKIAVPTKSIIATTDINLNVSAPDNEIDKLINKVKYLIFESFFATLQNLFGIVKQTCVNSLCRKLFFFFIPCRCRSAHLRNAYYRNVICIFCIAIR